LKSLYVSHLISPLRCLLWNHSMSLTSFLHCAVCFEITLYLSFLLLVYWIAQAGGGVQGQGELWLTCGVVRCGVVLTSFFLAILCISSSSCFDHESKVIIPHHVCPLTSAALKSFLSLTPHISMLLFLLLIIHLCCILLFFYFKARSKRDGVLHRTYLLFLPVRRGSLSHIIWAPFFLDFHSRHRSSNRSHLQLLQGLQMDHRKARKHLRRRLDLDLDRVRKPLGMVWPGIIKKSAPHWAYGNDKCIIFFNKRIDLNYYLVCIY
jgi:hypothetical protein